MNPGFWLRQGSEPLFPKLLWSRPESRHSAGKLLIVGGTKQSFVTAAEAYTQAIEAGAGSVRIVLPASVQKTLKKVFPEALYAPATLSGSFAGQGLSEILSETSWADAVFLSDDLGNNSETLAMLEKFCDKYRGSLSLPASLLGAFPQITAKRVLTRPQTLVYGDFETWQRLVKHIRIPFALTSDMGLKQLVERFHDLQDDFETHMLCAYQESTAVASEAKVSTTKTSWTTHTSAVHATVWWLQNPTKPFEAMTTSLVK